MKTNVLGTQCLLDAARHAGMKRFVLVSTDEVYGSAPTGEKFTENLSLAPNSPYAASKAGADLLARAHFRISGFRLSLLGVPIITALINTRRSLFPSCSRVP